MFVGAKDPDAIVDFTIDWGPWLERLGETIATSTWILDTDLTEDRSTNTDTTATVVIAGGEVGKRYTATNRIVTSGNITDERSIRIKVNNR